MAHATGICTHGHPTADAACIGAAYLVKLALDGIQPNEMISLLLLFTEGISKEFNEAIFKIKECLDWEDEEKALATLGEGWVSNYPILEDKGKVSAIEAKLKAEQEYDTYRKRQDRGVIDARTVEEDLRNPNLKISLLCSYASRINLIRTQNRAFHPRGKQKVFELSHHAFVVLRTSPEGNDHVLALTNVTGKELQLEISLKALGVDERLWVDLIGEKHW